MEAMLLFPTFVGKDTYQEKDNFKEKVFSTIHNHLSPEGYSHERTGHVTLHHDETYHDFFKFVVRSAKDYVATLDIDPEIYDYNVVKTWFNITKESRNPRHNHADAHLSFSYYIHTPKEVKKFLCFFSDNKINALYDGMMLNVKGFNQLNSESWMFETNEGDIFLFPSKLGHAVVAGGADITEGDAAKLFKQEEPIKSVDTLNKFRVVIAGDMVLTHKEKTAINLGLQPVTNWRTFA